MTASTSTPTRVSAKGILVNGGVSWGRERFNICDFTDNLADHLGRCRQPRHHHVRTRTGVLRRAPAVPAERQGPADVSVPVGHRRSISFQSLPGAQIVANYPLTNTTPGLTLGRAFSSVAPTVSLVPPGTLYLDRIYQTDIRFTKTVRYRATTIRPTVSVYNLFNANPTNTNAAYKTTYGTSWLAPTVILTPRFVDFGVQINF